MKVTVVVVGYNSWHYLQKNLASLDFLKDNDEVDVLYVDNGSTDETRTAISYSYPYVKMIACGVNRGISAARNIGMVNSSSDYICFLDSDTEVNEEAFWKMLEYMEEHEEVGICSCKLIGGDGIPQESCKRFPTRSGVLKSWVHLTMKQFGYNIFEESFKKTLIPVEGEDPIFVDYVVGACMFVRKKAQAKVGFFDENIFYGPEGADYCRRIQKAGYKVVCLPNVSISHDYQRPLSTRLFSRLTLKKIVGYSHYFRKVVKENMKGE
jgi:GT2 family glycosyltransferase